ncbi:MAG: cobalamin-binding protein [Gammaproteobacteria bacterium]|nr:cobalamin-binding protein [Gammaproteobacteria bacterium]RZV54858.1 MAG: cobalamin-binding protein [Pseudomonadales bacterium]
MKLVLHKRRTQPLLLAGLFAFLLGAGMLWLLRSGQQATTVNRDAAEHGNGSSRIMVTDYLGRQVWLDAAAQRIVALSPHIVENLFSAGLGERIVATVNFADFPATAKAIPRIGGISHFSREAILQYNPDLVIGWAAGYQGFSGLLQQLEALGVPVYADDPRSFNDIARSITDFATLARLEPPLDRLERRLHQPLQQLAREYKHASPQPVKVLYEIWHEPLQTLNKEHLVNQAIELCGGQNIFADAHVLAPKISLEAVLAANPEVIVASASSAARPQTLDNWLRWPSITAVANRQLYFVHGDLLSRHTLRMVEGVNALCQHIASARQQRNTGAADTVLAENQSKQSVP